MNVERALAELRGEAAPVPVAERIDDPQKQRRSGYGGRARVKRWESNAKEGAA